MFAKKIQKSVLRPKVSKSLPEIKNEEENKTEKVRAETESAYEDALSKETDEPLKKEGNLNKIRVKGDSKKSLENSIDSVIINNAGNDSENREEAHKNETEPDDNTDQIELGFDEIQNSEEDDQK